MNIIENIKKLRKSSVSKEIEKRLKEFEALGKKSNQELFKELCFCITTANSNAEKCIYLQKKIKNGFYKLPQKKLAFKLKTLGYRFPNTRAKYISNARKYISELKYQIEKNRNNEHLIRIWLAKNIKGIGFKEASHFLRNIGFKDLAIIDFHIIDLLTRNGVIKKLKSKSLSKKKYLEIEKILKKLGKKLHMNMAELDLYLWYLETGKVLK